MANKGKRQPQKADACGGAYLLLPHALLASEAFRTASDRAVKLLLVVCRHHNGYNNGRIGVSTQQLADGMGTQNHAAFTAALAELQARGLIEQTSNHPKGKRLSREFRLTFMPTDYGPATNEYRRWQEGDAGSRVKRCVATIATDTPVSVATLATDKKFSVATTATDAIGNDAKPPFSIEPSVATTATLISNHGERSPSHTPRMRENASGVSAAPPEAELRSRVLSFLSEAPWGWQGRIAKAADVPASTFNKFIKKNGPLNELSRVRVACALPRAEAEVRVG